MHITPGKKNSTRCGQQVGRPLRGMCKRWGEVPQTMANAAFQPRPRKNQRRQNRSKGKKTRGGASCQNLSDRIERKPLRPAKVVGGGFGITSEQHPCTKQLKRAPNITGEQGGENRSCDADRRPNVYRLRRIMRNERRKKSKKLQNTQPQRARPQSLSAKRT